MLSKLVLLGCLAFLLQNVNSLAIDQAEKDSNVTDKADNDSSVIATVEKDSEVNDKVEKDSSATRKELIKEAIKGFVDLVELYNLNVSIVGTHQSYYPTGDKTTEQLGISLKMPVNDDFLTEPTLDDNKQANYLKQFKKYANPLGIKTRVVKIEDGESEVADEHSVAETRTINSDNYEYLTKYHKGKQGYVFPSDQSHLTITNFNIKDPEEFIRHMKFVSGEIEVYEIKVTKRFPKIYLEEAKKLIPRLFVSISDHDILAKTLVDQLDNTFEKDAPNFQVMIGFNEYSTTFNNIAILQVADINILISCKV